MTLVYVCNVNPYGQSGEGPLLLPAMNFGKEAPRNGRQAIGVRKPDRGGEHAENAQEALPLPTMNFGKDD